MQRGTDKGIEGGGGGGGIWKLANPIISLQDLEKQKGIPSEAFLQSVHAIMLYQVQFLVLHCMCTEQ